MRAATLPSNAVASKWVCVENPIFPDSSHCSGVFPSGSSTRSSTTSCAAPVSDPLSLSTGAVVNVSTAPTDAIADDWHDARRQPAGTSTRYASARLV